MSPLSPVILCSLAVAALGVAQYKQIRTHFKADEGGIFLPARFHADGSLDSHALSGAKASCLNNSSKYTECKTALQSLRDIAWIQMQHEAQNVRIDDAPMADIIQGRSSEVKGFIMGGTRVTLPACKSPGASQEDPALYFRHIFKSGGHSIMANMHTLGVPALNGEITEHWGATMWEKDDMCHELQESKRAAQTSGVEGPTFFTFVREPIGRFISGSVERAADFLQSVFRGSKNPHVLPQSQYILGLLGSVPGPLGSCPVPLDIIGKLEHFDEDWASIGERLHCPPGSFPFNRSLGEHQSSMDPAHTVDAMRGAIEAIEVGREDSSQSAAAMYASAMHAALRSEGGALMRMLCWFYLGDYALFDYDIPEECGIVPVDA